MKLIYLLVLMMIQSPISYATSDTEIDFTENFQLGSKKDGYEEIGVINGVNYHIKYNGTGIFAGGKDNGIYGSGYDFRQNWRVLCTKDAITDGKKCTLLKPDISITTYPDGKYLLGVGYNHFPGSEVFLRIDDEASISTPSSNGGIFDFNTSSMLVEKMKAAKKITTRYTEWPYQKNIDKSSNMFGFNEALQYMLWAVKRIK